MDYQVKTKHRKHKRKIGTIKFHKQKGGFFFMVMELHLFMSVVGLLVHYGYVWEGFSLN